MKRQAQIKQSRLEECYRQHGTLMPEAAEAKGMRPSYPVVLNGRDSVHSLQLAWARRDNALARLNREKQQLCWEAHGHLMKGNS